MIGLGRLFGGSAPSASRRCRPDTGCTRSAIFTGATTCWRNCSPASTTIPASEARPRPLLSSSAT